MTDRSAVRGGRLDLIALRKSYGRAAAVEQLSIDVQPGEFFTILGPSGSGKTTTLMMVAGFVEPDAGRIMLDGRDITDLPTHRRALGVVFQSYALFPHMTVAENVGFALRMRDRPAGEIGKRVDRLLDLVQLRGLEQRYPPQLSGGQQQRVALARALVFEPALLLLDEPLGALDRLLREDLKLELRRVHRELGTSMIYVTHDQEEALVLSDRIMVMNQGRVEQVGTPEQVYERPSNMFVARFIGESNFLSGTVRGASDGKVTVTTDGAVVHGVAADAMREGDVVDLAIRPERLVVTRGEPVDGTGLRGVVTDRIYGGDSVRYLVRVGDGAMVTVKLTRRATEANAAPGDVVGLTWTADEAIVFKGPPASA